MNTLKDLHGSCYDVIVSGLIASGFGIYLIKRGVEGDSLLRGTLFTYVPRWVFIVVGSLLQLSLPIAIWLFRNCRR